MVHEFRGTNFWDTLYIPRKLVVGQSAARKKNNELRRTYSKYKIDNNDSKRFSKKQNVSPGNRHFTYNTLETYLFDTSLPRFTITCDLKSKR